jgi:hypothetical protein
VSETTRTEYAIKRRNHITGEWTTPAPEPFTREELLAAVDDYAPHFEAHVVFRTVTTSDWLAIGTPTDHAAQKLAEMRDLRGISTTEHEEH